MRAIRFPFRFTPGGKVQEARSYEDIVRGQVIDALMTNQGERVMRPRYGSDIQAALFDPADELVRKDAASQIKARLERLVTRALIRSVTLTADDYTSWTPMMPSGPGTVYIDISYRPSLYATDVNLTVPVSSEFIQRALAGGGTSEP
jgi:phage baseplate assembly protein W